MCIFFCFFFQAEDGIRDGTVTGVQTCALPICAGHDRRNGEEFPVSRDAQAADAVGGPAMSGDRLTRCGNIAPLLVFYACDEVEPQEREQIDAHLASCVSCATQLREEVEMQSALVNAFQPADHLDPSGALLAQCRSELSELLYDLSAPPLREQWNPFGWARRWMALRPAWSAAGLVLLGLAVGTQVALWIPGRDGGNSGFAAGQAMNVKAAPPLTNEDLSRMAVAGVNFAPAEDSSSGTVQ